MVRPEKKHLSLVTDIEIIAITESYLVLEPCVAL